MLPLSSVPLLINLLHRICWATSGKGHIHHSLIKFDGAVESRNVGEQPGRAIRDQASGMLGINFAPFTK